MKWALCAVLVGCGGAALPGGARAENCGGCHAGQHAQWQQSPHAASGTSPVFQALLPPVEAAWGSTARARCVACHAPGHGGDEAIGCVSCHAAIGNRGEANGALVVDLDAPLAGPSRAPRELPAHRTGPRGLLSSATLCGTCHEVHGPGLLEEPTLAEFRASPFSVEASCLRCHGQTTGGTQDHRFVGLDPPWGAPPAEAARAADAARALLASGLQLQVTAAGDVRLRNAGAGHAIPTGVAALRDVWVDVVFTDAGGARVAQPRALELGARLMRGDVEVALPTDATRVEARALAPGRERTWTCPPGATHVTATLMARAFRGSALDALGLTARADEVPWLTIATAAGP